MVSLAGLRRQTFSGRVVRSIASRGKGFEECFSLLTLPETPDDVPVYFLGRAYSLVEVRWFRDEPKVFPQALYERVIPSDATAEEFVAGFFAGNRVKEAITLGGNSRQPRLVEPTPISEVEFWELIGQLQGSVSRAAMERLTARLAALPEGVIVGFQDLLVSKLSALDHPANVVRTRVGGQEIASDDASLYYRCWVVTQGREAFNARLAKPGVELPRGRWQTAELLLGVASQAMDAATGGENIRWKPALGLVTGSNTQLWGEPNRPPRPIPKPHTLATLQKSLDDLAGWRGVVNHREDAFYDARLNGRWYSSRMLTQINGGFVETVVHWTIFDGSDPVAVFQDYAPKHAKKLGGYLVATDPVAPTRADCWNGELVFRIRRASPLDRQAYLNRYFHGHLV